MSGERIGTLVLLLCSAGLGAVQAAAQTTSVPATNATPDRAVLRDAAANALPPVSPRSTAATTLPAPAVLPRDPSRPAPRYLPDNGGRVSGLPYDRDAAALPPAASVTTLTQAITLAYHTNPQLLGQRQQARSADYRIPQARAAYGPTLDGSIGYGYTNTRNEILPGQFSKANGWSTTASLILSQPLFTFGRNAAAVAGAVALSQYQRDVLRVTEAQILSNVVIAYVSVMRDATAVTIARENLAILERQLSDNQKRFDVRDLTQTDLDQTRTRVEFGRAQLIQAEGQLGVSQKQFLQYVGAPPGELVAPDLLEVRFPSLADAYGYAESNSGLIRAAQSREKISRAQLEAAKAERLPRVDLRGTADYGALTPYSDSLRTTRYVGQVVVTEPLIDSGLRRARIDEAREANQSDWRLVDQALRDTRSSIGGSWDQLVATRASLDDYRASIAAAERAYQGAVVQQRAGDRSTLDVLDLARDLLTVRTSYNSAVANEYIARANLLAAAGMLEGPQLIPTIQDYDADAHYDRARGRSDIPLVTPALDAIDGVTVGDTHRDRDARDGGAQQALDQSVPNLATGAPVTTNAPVPR